MVRFAASFSNFPKSAREGPLCLASGDPTSPSWCTLRNRHDRAPDATAVRYPIDDLVARLGDIPVITDRTIVRRRSRDFFWYSPILAEELKAVAGDIIVRPRDEADVIRVASACATLRIP